MARRGNGEGSIFQRSDGLWSAEVDMGRGPDGKRRRKTVYGKTRREVSEKLKQLQAAVQAGGIVEPAKATLAQYLATWLESAAHTIRPATHQSYAQYLRVHVLPALGNVQLGQLRPVHLQQLYTNMLNAGLSRRTVQYVHAILRRALNQAVKLQLIATAPTAAVDAPRPDRREMSVLTPAQVEQLVTAMAGDPLAPWYYLAVATGCRRGELIALRWSDVDWTRPAITINRTAEYVGGQVIWTEPKTNRSRRTIPLPGEAVAVLEAHRSHQLEQQKNAGEWFTDQGLVFCRPDGSPLSPSHLTHHFALILDKAGLPRVRLHDLRHTHATMLLAAGVNPKIVAERLGHSSVVMTLDTYSHVLPTMQDEVTRRLDALLPRSKRPT